jgi:hypothetical protein
VVFRVPALDNNDLALDFDEDLSSLGVNNFDYRRSRLLPVLTYIEDNNSTLPAIGLNLSGTTSETYQSYSKVLRTINSTLVLM